MRMFFGGAFERNVLLQVPVSFCLSLQEPQIYGNVVTKWVSHVPRNKTSVSQIMLRKALLFQNGGGVSTWVPHVIRLRDQ